MKVQCTDANSMRLWQLDEDAPDAEDLRAAPSTLARSCARQPRPEHRAPHPARLGHHDHARQFKPSTLILDPDL
eukprot:2656369-Rhodomonas_salina.2